MTEEISNVSTGQVTYAVRDTNIDGKEIKQGDFMGIGDKGILSVGSAISEVTLKISIIWSTPSPLKISLIPSPMDTAMKPASFFGCSCTAGTSSVFS